MIMKITIELTLIEEKGIRAYLEQLDGGKVSKKDIADFVRGIVSTTIYSPAESVSSYINNFGS